MERLIYVLLNGERAVGAYARHEDALHDFFILDKTQPNSHVSIEPVKIFDKPFLGKD